MHLEHVLRQIQPDCANFQHGRLRQAIINDTTLAQRCRQALLRKAARTIEETWRATGALLDGFTPTECATYFRNAGYASA
jgi:hypothetical protein